MERCYGVLWRNICLHLNGWHTNARYQDKNKTPCYFCGMPVWDSLEHIFHCVAIQAMFPNPWRGDMARCFFLASSLEDEVLLASMIVYGLYSFHCLARHSSAPTHLDAKGAVFRMIN